MTDRAVHRLYVCGLFFAGVDVGLANDRSGAWVLAGLAIGAMCAWVLDGDT